VLNKIKGQWGEDKTVQFLENKGYTILERNYRTRYGEIDIICQDRDNLVFVEVKNWQTLSMENLEYGISEKRKKRMIRLADAYVMVNPQYDLLYKRMDLVFLSRRTDKPEHIVNVL